MSDEIKKILNQLEIVARKHTIKVCEDGSKIETMPANVVDELRLNNYSSKLLLDYITNLQTIEREYSNLLSENAELQQENDRLNEENKKLKIQLNNADNKNLELIEELNKEIDRYEDTISFELGYDKGSKDYKSRINKAIEYIKQQTKEGPIKDKRYFYSPEQANDLLEILRREDKE